MYLLLKSPSPSAGDAAQFRVLEDVQLSMVVCGVVAGPPRFSNGHQNAANPIPTQRFARPRFTNDALASNMIKVLNLDFPMTLREPAH